ncbi:MAG: hypothetical protein ACHRHE_07340 [Tepidisphaerales bacterium]
MPFLPVILVVFALLGMVAILWLRGLYDFRIVVTARGIDFVGRFPARHRADVADFLEQNITARPVLILGRWQAGRILRISFRGSVTPGVQQRIRNFLVLTVKAPQ